ncbi:MAG: hypothetical protein JOZ90_16905 [Alphaproteobacteria bacterium]|nr:hypothetical protein [Alphaproteobacteria bacterium]MBV9371507.1 hypothetical protein [Alphaproteobacteria bacterium]MBV9902751.1 hypothetical protein [Alphaproteobacteria bacterium]
MSVLDTPRIYFSGQMIWDPIVTNNYAEFYNEISCDPAPPNDPVADFRARAIKAVDPRNWNPQGTHRSTFLAEISGVDLGGGLDTSDPFVGAPANFLGMLVDLEPYGTFSSQLYFDAVQFGINGGCRISGARRWRAMSRMINFNRNTYNTVKAGIASTIWQTCVPKADALQIDPNDSPALQALVEALAADDVLGLTIRWDTYRTIYYDDPTITTNSGGQLSIDAQALVAKLNVPNSFQPNPARSLMVGTIGLWLQGEPICEPGDRALLAQGAAMEEPVGTAFARVTGGNLVLDLSNSVAEVDAQLTKQDLGTLVVNAMSMDGTTVVGELGTIPYPQYDRDAYLATSGIVTLPLDSAQVDMALASPLQIASNGSACLAEAVLPPSGRMLRAVPDTQQNVYLNQGDATIQVAVRVLDTGATAAPGVPVGRYSWNSKTGAVTFVDTANSDGDGIAWFDVSPAAGGAITIYLFNAGAGAPPPATLDPQTTPYIYVRTLPADADIGAMPPTWDNVYTQVLAKWNAMAPCMDNWLWLNDPAQVYAYGAVLKRLTDPANFELYRYMPVVRDMTVGERTLLYAFLDAPLAAGVPSVSGPVVPALAEGLAAEAPQAKAEAGDLPEATRLSEAMRD